MSHVLLAAVVMKLLARLLKNVTRQPWVFRLTFNGVLMNGKR
jgi:hypothetical protein